MARYCLLAFALVGCALADSGYEAPSQGYGAPQQSGYGAPTAPAYDPQPSYGAPAYEQTGYEVQEEPNDIFNLDKLITLIPFFLAVLAAIIVAQLIAPLIGLLFGAKVGLLAPLGSAKIDLVNTVLAPFNLALCNLTPALAVATGRSSEERSASGFFSTPETIQALTNFAHKAFERKLLQRS